MLKAVATPGRHPAKQDRLPDETPDWSPLAHEGDTVLDSGALKRLLLDLLADSPIVRESVIDDIQLLVWVGEEHLAFDTLCSWLFEDDLVITRAYYDRLVAAAAELEVPGPIRRLDELIRE